MPTRVLLVVIVAAAAVGCVRADDELKGTSWSFVSLEVDGEQIVVEQPLFLDVGEYGFWAETMCNTASGELGGEIAVTLMACGDERATATESHMLQALRERPSRHGGQLVFDDGTVRLEYESYTDPTVPDLFAVLGNMSADVDESALPPESVTGSVPPAFDMLVPVPSPSSDVDLFLARLDDSVCVVGATADAIDRWCDPPRMAERRSLAFNVPMHGVRIVRVALIPDRFADAAAARPDLGVYASNLLVVADDAPAGWQTLTNDDGDTFTVLIR